MIALSGHKNEAPVMLMAVATIKIQIDFGKTRASSFFPFSHCAYDSVGEIQQISNKHIRCNYGKLRTKIRQKREKHIASVL